MLNTKIGKLIAALSFLIGIGGCTSTPKIQEFANTANMADEVARFATDMRTAADRQVDVLSPSAYHQADEALKSAQSDEQKGKDRKEILHEVAKGRAQLNRANQSAELSRTNMDDVVTARQAAMAAGAPKAFAEDFKKADEHLISLTSEIEDNNLSNVAENRGKLQKEYLDVELKAIKQTNLGAAQATVAIAVKEGAKEYAQQSLAIAEKNINDTEAFIVANRHDTVAVKSRSDEAIAAANHLLKITRAAKSGKNISPEQVALSLEKEQNRTQQERNELTAERQNAKELAIETGDLKSEQAFNRSFEAARSEFTSNEAEVYRQGNRLVIRLRALEFPVNQAVLRGENFPLLAKVAKVVKGFENPTVVIEGHTDSDGGKALNKKLSSERARAISDYLVSSQAIGAGRISAVGYGFERPLSSNKSAKGRAENRRVDVVITPQVMGG